MPHVPVLLDSLLHYLDPRPNRDYIDATLGGGGYTQAILEKNAPQGRVLGIDWNEEAVEKAKQKFGGGAEARSNQTSEPPAPTRRGEARPQRGRRHRSGPSTLSERLIVACGNFRDIEPIALSNSLTKVAGVVFDLGLSSNLIESSGRGFSYRRNEPLLMTYTQAGANPTRTARTIVNSYSERELARIFKEYGQERWARKIAETIVAARRQKQIETSDELARVIEAVSRSVKTKARIFQALRIETNQELENLSHGLNGAWRVLEQEGRLVVVSFHSLEDKIVKDFFRQKHQSGQGKILTKKPVRPSQDEINGNRRSRSAKLRAIKKIVN